MNGIFSKKNIMRTLVFGALILVFSKSYVELIPVSNIFYALEISPSEQDKSTLAVYLIYMFLWMGLLVLAKTVSYKLIPSESKIGTHKDKIPSFKPQITHWAIVGVVVVLAVIFSAIISFSNLTTNQIVLFFVLGLFIFSFIVALIKLYAVFRTIEQSNTYSDDNPNEK